MNDRYRMLYRTYVKYRYRRLLYDYDAKMWRKWDYYND